MDVAVCVIRKGRRFLIAQRTSGDSFGKYWEFPGGKLRDGETPELCASREAKEEIGLDLEVEDLLMTLEDPYPGKSLRLHFLMCKPVGTEFRAIECQDVRWVDVDHLKDYRFPPANDKIISHLIENYSRRPIR